MKSILVLIILSCSIQVQAQVKFQKLSLNEAIQKALETNKLVFAQFESETCDECNDVGNAGLSGDEAGKHINKNFIPIKISLIYPDRESFIINYNPGQTIGTFFISGEGELIYRFPNTTTFSKEYINQSEIAIAKHAEGRIAIKELDSVWKNDPKNYIALQKNLERRFLIGFPTDSLLDVFVQRLPPDSLRSETIIKFIATMAPSLFSRANAVLYGDMNVFNQVWNSLPLQQRINLNNRRIFKSMQKAIEAKNQSMAYRVATFSAGTHNNPEMSMKVYEKLMLDYYYGVNDTLNYLNMSVAYYEKYYMSVPVEKVKKQDSSVLAEQLKKGPFEFQNKMEDEKYKTVIRFTPKTQFFAKDLNAGAWMIYTCTKEKYFLDKALSWARRGVEFNEAPDVMDTYARLLYNSGNKKEGIAVQEKAINILKQKSFNYSKYKLVLDAMKKGVTWIDPD